MLKTGTAPKLAQHETPQKRLVLLSTTGIAYMSVSLATWEVFTVQIYLELKEPVQRNLETVLETSAIGRPNLRLYVNLWSA